MIGVIILTYTKDNESYNVTQSCINSFLQNNVDKIVVIESYKDSMFTYSGCDFISPIANNIKFNYNQYCNIGIKHLMSSGCDFIVVSNNDVIVHDNCIDKLKKAFDENVDLVSISPVDRNWHRHSRDIFPKDDELYFGYRTSFEVAGWFIMFKSCIIEKMGYLDERFEFYYQDNDYAMCLQHLQLKHALHTGAHITHLLSFSHRKNDENIEQLADMQKQHKKFESKWSKKFHKYKRLSLLICTIPQHTQIRQRLLDILSKQKNIMVEVLMCDSPNLTIGTKRNILLQGAVGEYVAFIDDGDFVSDNYIESILRATDSKPDGVNFMGIIIFNGEQPKMVDYNHKYHTCSDAYDEAGNVVFYNKSLNHLSPIKSTIAKAITFPNTSDGEDFVYSTILKSKVNTTETISDVMYFYDLRSPKTLLPDYEIVDKKLTLVEQARHIQQNSKNITLKHGCKPHVQSVKGNEQTI